MIAELAPTPPAAGILPLGAGEPVAMQRPALERRTALITLGDKIARALGDEVDTPPDPEAPASRRRRARPDFG